LKINYFVNGSQFHFLSRINKKAAKNHLERSYKLLLKPSLNTYSLNHSVI